jgi:hypothetical protein
LIVPVLTLNAKAPALAAGTPSVSWVLLPGSKKISTKFFSVQVIGSSAGLFEFEPPKVRVEIRAKGKSISKPVSASYGFQDATSDVEMKRTDDNPRELAPNTVALMLAEEPYQKTVSVLLLDATTGAELAAIREVEVVPASF